MVSHALHYISVPQLGIEIFFKAMFEVGNVFFKKKKNLINLNGMNDN